MCKKLEETIGFNGPSRGLQVNFTIKVVVRPSPNRDRFQNRNLKSALVVLSEARNMGTIYLGR